MDLKLNDNLTIDSLDNETNLKITNLEKDFIFDLRAIKKQLNKLITNTQSISNETVALTFISGIKEIENEFAQITDNEIIVTFNKSGEVGIYLAVVFSGFLMGQYLKKEHHNLKAYSHISKLADLNDITYYDLRNKLITSLGYNTKKSYSNIQLQILSTKLFENLHQVISKNLITKEIIPTLDPNYSQEMLNYLQKEKPSTYDGTIETIIINVPKNIGMTFTNNLSSKIAEYLFMVEHINSVCFGQETSVDINSSLHNIEGGIKAGISTGDDIIINTQIRNLTTQDKLKNISNFIPLIQALIYLALKETKSKCC